MRIRTEYRGSCALCFSVIPTVCKQVGLQYKGKSNSHSQIGSTKAACGCGRCSLGRKAGIGMLLYKHIEKTPEAQLQTSERKRPKRRTSRRGGGGWGGVTRSPDQTSTAATQRLCELLDHAGEQQAYYSRSQFSSFLFEDRAFKLLMECSAE